MPFGRPERCKPCAADPRSLQKRCRGPFLGGSSLPVAGMTVVHSAQQLRTACKSRCGHQLCRQSLFLQVQACRLGGLIRCKRCAAAPHSLHKRCRGHQLCRQSLLGSLFLGVQACRLAGLKGVNPAQRLHTACKSVAVTLFLGVQACLWQASQLYTLRSSSAPCQGAAVATNCAGRVGVQACRLAGLKGVNAAQQLRTTCTSAAVVFSWGFKLAVWQA